jgi:outer membrane cobalamin receptor
MTENLQDTEKFGVETKLKHKISAYFSHELSYYYLWAIDSNLKTILDYMPRNTATYALKYTSRSGIKASIDFDYVSSQLTGDIVTTELPEYLLVNLKASKKIKDIELWAKVDNATNKQYQTRLGYPLPGVTYYAGITVKFWD